MPPSPAILSVVAIRATTAGAGSGQVERLLLSALPRGRLLNLGSGAGLEIEDRTVINVDHVLPTRPSGIYVIADAMNLPFCAAAFDGALLKDVVEHLVEPIAALAEVHRVSRPTARLTVEVPRALPRAVWADPTHVRGFTARAITTALALSGWTSQTPRRIGGFRGAGRLGLEPHLVTIMRLPGIGHWLGTNWLVCAVKAPGTV